MNARAHFLAEVERATALSPADAAEALAAPGALWLPVVVERVQTA